MYICISKYKMKQYLLFFILLNSISIFSQNKIQPKNEYYFYENKGQIVDQNGNAYNDVRYLFNSAGLNVQLKKGGFSYDVYEIEKTKKKISGDEKNSRELNPQKPIQEFDYKSKFHRVDIDLLNSNKNAEIVAEGKSTDYENYYNIKDKPEGVTNVYRYQKITYKNIYPNIDLVFFKPNDTSKAVEYNFVVKPNGKISDIKLKFKGAKTKLKDGKLSMNLRFGEMQENIPHSWLEDTTAKKDISVKFKEIESDVFGFEAPQDSFDKTVVIDPVPTRIWGTYYGGEGKNYVLVKTDNLQNVYLLGTTDSTTNIATNGAIQTTFGGGYDDLFIAKMDQNGQRMWATYYGNEFQEDWGTIDFDDNYNIYASGTEYSWQTYSNITSIYRNIFLLKLDPNGQKIYRTQFHYTNGFKKVSDLKVYKDNLYVIGQTNSVMSISTPGVYQEQNPVNNNGGHFSGTITKLENNTGNIVWSSFFGGENGANTLEKIVNIDDNSVDIVGLTRSTNMPLANAFQNINNGGSGGTDGIYIKLSSDGKSLLNSSYIGNDYDDIITYARVIGDILQISGNKLVNVTSAQITYIPFIYKVDLSKNKIIDKSLLSNLRGSFSYIDEFGNTYFTGESYFANAIVSTPNAYLENKINFPYFFKIDNSNQLVWCTYYGGISSYSVTITKDNAGYVYFSGTTDKSSYGFATPGTFREKPLFDSSAYVAKFKDCESNVKVSYTPICSGKDLELKAEGGDTYEWFGPNNFHSFDQNPIIKNAQITNSGEYFVRMTGANTCGGIFTLNVVIGSPAPPKPDVANLPDIKGDCNTKLIAPTATDGCGNVFVATTIYQTSNYSPGTYYIVWTYNDGNGNVFTQPQKVIITSPALPTANSPQAFCAINNNPKVSDIIVSGQNIIWYDASGNIINTSTSLIDGTIYYASQTINGCESSKLPISVKVNNTPQPTANQNQDFCSSRSAQIKDLAVTGTSLIFYDNSGNVLPANTLLQNNTSYFVTQTLNNCESVKLEIKVTLTANSLPANNYNLVFCNDTTANTKTQDLTKYQENIIANSSTYSFDYFDQNNNQILDFASRILQLGVNTFNVKVKSSDGCWKMVQLVLQLNPKPVVNLPTNAEFCNGLSVDLDAGAGFQNYTWTKDNSTTIVSNAQILHITETGTYTVEVTNSSNCKSTSSTVVTQSILAQILKIEVSNSDIKVILSSSGQFEYSLDNANWQDSNEFSNLKNGNYTVYVRTKLGCIIGSLNFSIFNIPNAFTPNGDGENDKWKIFGIENYPNSEITVIDRQGVVVLHKITSGTFEWDGQLNGRKLSIGTYWYIIKISDGRILQGFLLIKNRN